MRQRYCDELAALRRDGRCRAGRKWPDRGRVGPRGDGGRSGGDGGSIVSARATFRERRVIGVMVMRSSRGVG